MTLFDYRDRDDETPGRHNEAWYSFLNRSSRRDVVALRRVIEDWVSRFDVSRSPDFEGRFRSDDDRQHRSAVFELMLHELLLRLGCRVTIHPIEKGRSPDFLIDPPHDAPFYLEATVVHGHSAKEAAARKRLNRLYDELDRMLSAPNITLAIKVDGDLSNQPSARKIADAIRSWLETLTFEAAETLSGERDYPTLTIQPEPSCRLEFTAYPRSKPREGSPLGIWGPHESEPQNRIPLVEDLRSKAAYYGVLEKPLVLAINFFGESFDRIDQMEALFGRERWMYGLSREGVTSRGMRREGNGFWQDKDGPTRKHVPAVLICTGLSPVTAPRSDLRLYHNPHATMRHSSPLRCFPQAVPVERYLQFTDGASAGSILGL